MNTAQTRILVVDDDIRLRDLLSRFLSEQGFQVTVAADGQGMERMRKTSVFDLIVLDVMMPGEDGLSICKRLRDEGEIIPIIMLTAKGEDDETIEGLDIGADDYIVKPFNPRELVARINAVLRRHELVEKASRRSDDETLQPVDFGPFRFDPVTRTLRKGDENIPITKCEYDLLRVFSEHPNKPLSRATLMEITRGRGYTPSDRSLDVQISRLRKLIEDDVAQPRYIQTVWGAGYVFVPQG